MRGLSVHLLVAMGCGFDVPTETPPSPASDPPRSEIDPGPAHVSRSLMASSETQRDAATDTSASASVDAGPPSSDRDEHRAAPIEHRKTSRSTMVYDGPSFAAAFRGRLPAAAVFDVFEHAPGDARCTDGWLRIHRAAYVCATNTTPVDRRPSPVVEIPEGMVTPHFYAELRKGDDGKPVPAPLWRTRHALARGEPPLGHLEPAHDYAFVRRIRTRNGAILVRENHRAVREADVRRFRPSEFAGRDLVEHPIPAGTVLAWANVWQFVPVLDRPDPRARQTGKIRHHDAVLLTGPPVRKGGIDFYPVEDPPGWVDGGQIRRFIPFEPVPGIAADELWIDVDLAEQTLSLMRGEEATFVTLVSTGSWKDPTPTGVYRIEAKKALDDMRSRATDEDEYFVEAVPWALYFDGRYALHGTYWHNRFGLRTSHGCVNLAPRDARRVFEAVRPALPPGWLLVYEHAEDLGTLVRIRQGDVHPPDRRGEPRRRHASDYG